MANSIDLDQMLILWYLIWACTFCWDLSEHLGCILYSKNGIDLDRNPNIQADVGLSSFSQSVKYHFTQYGSFNGSVVLLYS